MVVNGINTRNRTYRERFQCLLQHIVFEAGIGNMVLKISVDVIILKSLICFILPIAAASMIFFKSFSVDVNDTLLFFWHIMH